MGLSDFDGNSDEALAKTINVWVENAPESGVQFFKRKGEYTLADIMGFKQAHASKPSTCPATVHDRAGVRPGDRGHGESDRRLQEFQDIRDRTG